MEYKKTINSILSKLTQQLPIVKENDLLETFKTIYHNTNNKIKNIIIEDVEMSIPIVASRATKNLMKKDGSLLASIYNDMNSGDILKVIKTNGTKLYCENLSIKPEYRQEIIIDKLNILKEEYKLIERTSQRLKKSIEKLNIES
jgi:hypothetical protein